MWLKALYSDGNNLPNISKISQAMTAFRPKLNEKSQCEFGDKTLRVDEEEILLTRYNGASNKQQRYPRHKDSYVHDKNNELHGMALRKLSMVIFLNENIDQVGKLRLYTKGDESVEGVIDISPRLGRAVLFKSEEMIH